MFVLSWFAENGSTMTVHFMTWKRETFLSVFSRGPGVCVCVAVFFHYCLLENCFTLHSRFVIIWNLACWLSFQHSMSKEFLSFSLALSRSCSKTAFFFCAQPQGRGAVREFLLLLPSLEFMRKQLLRILFLRLSASIQSTNQTARLLDSGRLFFLIYVLC